MVRAPSAVAAQSRSPGHQRRQSLGWWQWQDADRGDVGAACCSRWVERPAILSRGYARRRAADGVVVVSDGERVLEPVERSGDEPQMLARALPGVPVLVCPDRHLAGRLAERQLDCTVMLLDDGFQHLALGREVDVLVMPASDLDDAVLPSGRLREPLDAASSADCLLVPGSRRGRRRAWRRRSIACRSSACRTTTDRSRRSDAAAPCRHARRRGRRHCPPRALLHGARRAGIRGRPRAVASRITTGSSPGDLDRIRAIARDSGADLVVTTEKDAVRVAPQPGWAVLPMTAVDRAGRSVCLMASGPAVRYRLEFALAQIVRRACASCR